VLARAAELAAAAAAAEVRPGADGADGGGGELGGGSWAWGAAPPIADDRRGAGAGGAATAAAPRATERRDVHSALVARTLKDVTGGAHAQARVLLRPRNIDRWRRCPRFLLSDHDTSN
jgi:hypothetical protein